MLSSSLFLSFSLAFISPSPPYAHADTSCGRIFADILGVNPDEAQFLRDIGGNLYKLPELSPADITRRNQGALAALDSIPRPAARGRRQTSFGAAEIEKLYERTLAMPPVRESLCSSYKGSGKLGFCFGRALAVHLEALRAGLQKESVRKIWLVGPLEGDGNKWRYHVATLVRRDDGEWIALDHTLGKPLSAKEWTRQLLETYDQRGEVRLFSTGAGRLFPYQPGKYEKVQLNRPVFRGFFEDVLALVRQESRGTL